MRWDDPIRKTWVQIAARASAKESISLLAETATSEQFQQILGSDSSWCEINGRSASSSQCTQSFNNSAPRQGLVASGQLSIGFLHHDWPDLFRVLAGCKDKAPSTQMGGLRRAKAWKIPVHPHHLPAIVHPQGDPVNPHVLKLLIDEVVGKRQVPCCSRKGAQEIAVTQRALANFVAAHIQCCCDSIAIGIRIQPCRLSIGPLPQWSLGRAKILRSFPADNRIRDNAASLAVTQPVRGWIAWVQEQRGIIRSEFRIAPSGPLLAQGLSFPDNVIPSPLRVLSRFGNPCRAPRLLLRPGWTLPRT
mmetsp:Transcript_21453/g.54829  ORF Transcript_21453/g.54829 Transcript_21453/m.54829 type:complete len:304 (-) Transcript_21453:211-1122(-)